jgi:hypothetical protein
LVMVEANGSKIRQSQTEALLYPKKFQMQP